MNDFLSCFQSTLTTVSESSPLTTTAGEEGESHPICGETSGIKPDPVDCQKYYFCNQDGQGGWLVDHMSCPNGLLFDQRQLLCNWPQEASCNIQSEFRGRDKAGFKCPGEGYFPDGQSKK